MTQTPDTTERIATALERIAVALETVTSKLDDTNAKLTDMREGIAILNSVIESVGVHL